MDDARDVLGAQEVLRLALAVVAVGVDEDHMVAFARAVLVHHQHAGGNAGAVEQASRQADDRLQPAVVDEVPARLARSEEHTSELQSLMRISYAVFCLKKKKTQIILMNKGN